MTHGELDRVLGFNTHTDIRDKVTNDDPLRPPVQPAGQGPFEQVLRALFPERARQISKGSDVVNSFARRQVVQRGGAPELEVGVQAVRELIFCIGRRSLRERANSPGDDPALRRDSRSVFWKCL